MGEGNIVIKLDGIDTDTALRALDPWLGDVAAVVVDAADGDAEAFPEVAVRALVAAFVEGLKLGWGETMGQLAGAGVVTLGDVTVDVSGSDAAGFLAEHGAP